MLSALKAAFASRGMGTQAMRPRKSSPQTENNCRRNPLELGGAPQECSAHGRRHLRVEEWARKQCARGNHRPRPKTIVDVIHSNLVVPHRNAQRMEGGICASRNGHASNAPAEIIAPDRKQLST